MTNGKSVALYDQEHIIAVVPSHESGPGWSNSPCKIYIMDGLGKVRTEWIQPEERSDALHTLFNTATAMHHALVASIKTKRKGLAR